MSFYIYNAGNGSSMGQNYSKDLKTLGHQKDTIAKKKIFLVDDDEDDRSMFKKAMADLNLGTVWAEASNGKNALELLHEKNDLPDLIFLDINMPVMTGWELLTRLKETASLKLIPVVMFSSSSNVRDINIAFMLDAFCYWTKPADWNSFKKILEIFMTRDINKVKAGTDGGGMRHGVYFSTVK